MGLIYKRVQEELSARSALEQAKTFILSPQYTVKEESHWLLGRQKPNHRRQFCQAFP